MLSCNYIHWSQFLIIVIQLRLEKLYLLLRDQVNQFHFRMYFGKCVRMIKYSFNIGGIETLKMIVNYLLSINTIAVLRYLRS